MRHRMSGQGNRKNAADKGNERPLDKTIAEFNGAVSDLQKALRDGEKNLKGLQPPADTQAPNKQLAQAFGDLADALEAVKEARRVSIMKAREELAKLGGSAAIKNGRAAIQKLHQLGYAVDAATP